MSLGLLSAGMGMFSEAYFIFAIGNIEPLFAVESPNCWACTDEAACTCNQTTVDNVQASGEPRFAARRQALCFTSSWAGGLWSQSISRVLAATVRWRGPASVKEPAPMNSHCPPLLRNQPLQNLEISAIIVGMLSFGFVADVIGRKWGSR